LDIVPVVALVHLIQTDGGARSRFGDHPENISAQVIRVKPACFHHILHTPKQGLTVPDTPIFIRHKHDDFRIGEEGEEPITGRMKPIPIAYG
jgi:hypothetical protein